MTRTVNIPITRISSDGIVAVDDDVVVEEPLEIRVAYHADGELREQPLSVTMRTPGDEEELAAGFVFTEGIVREPAEIESSRIWGSANVVRVALAAGVRVDWQRLQRHFYTSSSCGVCGKTSIDALRTQIAPLPESRAAARVDAAVIMRMPETLRAAQQTFASTGALHAAALFEPDGTLLRVREDVGRHNALDKLIGSYVRDGVLPPDDAVLLVSGRTSFELVQKSAAARIAIIAAVGAPSSLAVELANEYGITLLGFVRDGRCNVYTSALRIEHAPDRGET
jgi:FdhD protein